MRISLFNIEKTTFQNSSKQTEYSGMPPAARCQPTSIGPQSNQSKQRRKEGGTISIHHRIYRLQVIISLLQFVRCGVDIIASVSQLAACCPPPPRTHHEARSAAGLNLAEPRPAPLLLLSPPCAVILTLSLVHCQPAQTQHRHA